MMDYVRPRIFEVTVPSYLLRARHRRQFWHHPMLMRFLAELFYEKGMDR